MAVAGKTTSSIACAWLLSALFACSSAGDSPAQSTDLQSSAGTSAAAPAAQSGRRSATPIMPTMSPVTTATAGAAGASVPAIAAGSGARAPAAEGGAAGASVPATAAGSGARAPAAEGGAGTSSAGAGAPATPSAGTGAPAAGTAANAGTSDAFILTPVDFPMYEDELTFPLSANPPTNQSPEFTWTGVPAEARSLALAFRDLGNSAVKWIIWDMPPTLMHLPPNVTPVAMPAEVPGSSQLGSLNNQGYAGPGSGARQYDFTLWALDVEQLPVTPRMTTVQIHELLELHEVKKTPPVLVRNTRNL